MDVDNDNILEEDNALQFASCYTSALQSILLANNSQEWKFGEELLLCECGLRDIDREIEEDLLNQTRIQGIFRRPDARRAIFLHRLLKLQDGPDEMEKRLNLMKKLGRIEEKHRGKWLKADELRREKEAIARQKQVMEQRKLRKYTEEHRSDPGSALPSPSIPPKIRVVNPNFQEPDEIEHASSSSDPHMNDRPDLYDGASTTQSVEVEARTSTQEMPDPLQIQLDSEDNGAQSSSVILTSIRSQNSLNMQSLDSIFEQDDLLLQKKQMIGVKRRRELDSSDSDSGSSNASKLKGKTRTNKKGNKSKSRPRKRVKIDPSLTNPFFRDGNPRQGTSRPRAQRNGRRS